jgi:hypothetical protein
MYHSKIAGLGYYVPENIVTNDDLSKCIDTNDAWIQVVKLFLDFLLNYKNILYIKNW